MKPAHLRDNPRKLKINPHQSKDVQSQSPPHKKLLKKIEMLHKDPAPKNDLSLKDNLLVREPKEEVVVDFRVEIERRFMKASANQTFKFPRSKSSDHEDESDGDEKSSSDTSFESLKHVTIYDLSSQNHRLKKIAQLKHAFQMTVTENHKNGKSAKQASKHQDEEILSSSTDSADFEEEEQSGVPIEVRLRDKNTATYQKLLKMIEKQLNPNVVNALNEQGQQEQEQRERELAARQQTQQEQPSKSGTRNLGPDDSSLDREHIGVVHHTTTGYERESVDPLKLEQYKKKERTVRSQGRHERVQYNASDMQRHAKASSNSGIQGVRKNLSQEKVGAGARMMDSGITIGSSMIERTFTQLSSSTMKGDSKIDLQKLTQESFKKLYNSNILKSITPQYMKSGQLGNNLKDNVFKTFSQENYPGTGILNMKTPMGNLYQKAKSKVMNSELKGAASIVNSQNRYHVKTNNTSMSATKREETPKDVSRKINFNNFYGSPESALDKSGRVMGQSSQNNIAKKESVRAFQIASPYKKTATNEGPVVASYDFSSQPRIAKKPSFKLDLNKKAQAYRDVLSTARTRKKRTPDRCSEIAGADSGMRGSYEMQQYSYILNTSTQKNSNKKQIGFAPSTNTAKSLAFNKAFFSYKQ